MNAIFNVSEGNNMQDEVRQLIDRVEAYEIDPGDKALGFAERLARENRWSVAYSQRVIREYKRFCILALASGHHVTPSEAVDQVWHLHLTYTRSYWDRFCGETLGRPLHHEPTAGGSSEGAKFHDWYSETLSSYQRLFGEAPPADVWPDPAARFRHAGQWAWINVGHYWLVPRVVAWPVVAAALLLGLMSLPGCGTAIASVEPPEWLAPIFAVDIFPFSLGGSGFLMFYSGLCAIGLAVVAALRGMATPMENVSPSADSVELSVDELAVLSGGGARLAHVSLTRLYADQHIDAQQPGWFSSGKLTAKPSTRPFASSIDQDLYTEIQRGTPTSRLMRAVKPHYERINHKLVGLQLRDDSTFHSNAAMAIIGAIVILGIMRLLQGILAGEEIGFLVVLMILFTIVAVLINLRRTKVTAAGKACLERNKEQLSAMQPGSGSRSESGGIQQDNDLALLSVALLGTSAVAGLDGFGPLAPVLQNMNNRAGSSGCGTGCSTGCSSGCGGGGCGGGGCGGCGG
jgi:uncharacterized protein (TIGR04222 family)